MADENNPITNGPEQQPPHPKTETIALTPGKRLRETRREKGLSVEVIAEATKISINNVRAIEDEDYEKLPADTFIRGLVSLYGNFLGLEGATISREFLAVKGQNRPEEGQRNRIKKRIPSAPLAPKKFAEPAHPSSATVALLLLSVIVLSFTGYCLYTSWNPFSTIAQKTGDMQVSMMQMFNDEVPQHIEDTTNVSPLSSLQEPQAIPENDQNQRGSAKNNEPSGALASKQFLYILSADFQMDCTVEVHVDNQEMVRMAVTKNDTMQWQAKERIKILFDTPNAATLKLNGAPWPFPKAQQGDQATILLPEDLLDQ